MEAKSPSIGFPLMGKCKSGSRESWRKVSAPKPENSVTNTLRVHPDLSTLEKADDPSTGPNLCRVGWKGVQRVGQLLSLRLMLNKRECSTQQRWHLWYGRMTHQRVLGVVSLPLPLYISRANNPRLSSGKSSPLCPLSAQPQAEWLQVKFCALAL